MSWPEWDNLDIAEPVKPLDGDVLVVTTEQFDDWLRGQGIDTLLYTGFSANLCILDSPAAIKAMAALGYRCVILGQATTADQFPETNRIALPHAQCHSLHRGLVWLFGQRRRLPPRVREKGDCPKGLASLVILSLIQDLRCAFLEEVRA